MHSLNNLNEFIYNNDNDIALTLSSNSIFEGNNFQLSNMYSHFEIWLLQSHHCKIKIKNADYNLIQGDLLIFSESDDITIITSENNAIFIKLQIDAEAFIKFTPLSISVNISDFFNNHSKKFGNKIPVTHPAAKIIHDGLNNMTHVFGAKQNGYEIEILKECLNILLTIMRDTDYINSVNTDLTAKVSNKSSVSLKRAIDYIDTHITEELTLERISEIADLSPNYLSNIFREQIGVRLWDYIGEKRIHLATQLLINNPDDSIISIALKCGFNNCPNFNRTFKKYTGQTPMKYKTSILRQED